MQRIVRNLLPICRSQFFRTAVITGNQVRPGMVLDLDGAIYRCSRTQHVKPGKGGAYMQVELKDERSGTKLTKRFRVAEAVKVAELDPVENFQFLYMSGNLATIMDMKSFDQFEVDIKEYDLNPKFLDEGTELKVQKLQNSIYSVKLPSRVVLEVKETTPHTKTASINPGNYKTAILSNGMQMKIPPFVEQGEKILICTETCSYLERQ